MKNTLKHILSLGLMIMFAFVLTGCMDFAVPTTQLPTPDGVGNFESYDQLKTYLGSYFEKQGDYYFYRNWSDEAAIDGVATTTTAAVPSNDQSGSSDDVNYSKTNDQVEGVNESDRILTDGHLIYVSSNSSFYIIDAQTLEILYTHTFEDAYVYGMYLYGTHLVLMTSEYHYEVVNDPSKTDEEVPYYYYYYSYSYGVKVDVFDVSDPSNISISKSYYFESSSLVDSRMIDGTVYLVMDNYAIYYGYDEETFVPQYMDSTVSDQSILLDASDIYYMPNDNYSFGYLLLASFQVDDDSQANVKAYLGSSYQIYMSLNNLYTIIYRYYFDDALEYYRQTTYILRFEIQDGELVFQAIGEVSGMPLNQFSMDEYEGVFRIATTEYTWTETSTISNKLYLLNATSVGQMEMISALAGLGKPGERIYAVRYTGDTAYVVTFVNTDPLYKLDLSDPSAPAVVGELYEEGVSDYLHPISDSLMVGIGRQAETNEYGWTYFTGVKVALYDTSGDDPVNLDTYLVEGEYSYSNVMYDHKAFVLYEPTGADFVYIAIPVYEYTEYYYAYYQSAYVFKVYYSGSLEFVTKLTHFVEDSQNPYYYYYDTIDRTLMIGDSIYTVSYSKIQQYDMANGFELLNTVVLEENYYYYIYPEGTWVD